MEGDNICQTELMFIDLMILVNFSPICQSEISLAGLTNFAIFITACISGNRNWLGGSSIKKKKERKKRKEKKRKEKKRKGESKMKRNQPRLLSGLGGVMLFC